MSSDEWIGKKISDVFVSQEPALNKRNSRTAESTFHDTLKQVGFVTGKNNDANELNVDQAVFARDLTKLLCDKNSAHVKNFIRGFEKHLEDEIRLKWSLMPTNTSATCETARNASQDSLVHLILNIETIQENVTNIMLAKLAEFSFCESSTLYDRSEGKTVACLIISQFRWVNKLVKGEALADKLIELIEATPSEVQKDIIKLIPDVINEFDHGRVAKSLGDILQKNQELNVSILDTLTNLNIEPDLMSEIRNKVIETVVSANIEDLPVLVKFILQDLTTTEVMQVIRELQDKLDFNSTFNPIISSTPLDSKSAELSNSIESCVLHTIQHSIKFQKILSDAWLKYLELLVGAKNHKILDIFVILIILSLELNEKKLESIVKSKIKAGDINEDLLQLTFRCHHKVLKEFARELMKIAHVLLKAHEQTISNFGCAIYVKCFIWFDAFYKQEVIGNLITHVGNRTDAEINAALKALLSMVRLHTQKVVPYAVFIKNLLDHLDELSLNQIRKVHEMLSILAYQGGSEGTILLNEMQIIIRKQLTNKNLRYRKMGIIGALMAAKTAADRESDSQDPDVSISSNALELDECYQHSIKLLQLVSISTSDCDEAFALFCDELSHILFEKKLGTSILEWIGHNLLGEFEETYIIDVKPDQYIGKNIIPRFALDVVDEPVAINLFEIVQNEMKKLPTKQSVIQKSSSAHNQSLSKVDLGKILKTLVKLSSAAEKSSSSSTVPSPLKLCPLFRLLRAYRQVEDGNLDAIDALLGCSILLPDFRNLKMSSLSNNEKTCSLNVLFFCINWLREAINAFAASNEEEIKVNVICRLQLLIELESLACKYVTEVKGYTPPIANFDCDDKSLASLKLPSHKQAKRKKKTTKAKVLGKKKKKGEETAVQTQIETLNGSNESSSDSDEIPDKSISAPLDKVIKCLQPYFREFDIQIFSLLRSEITFKPRNDIYTDKVVKSEKLHVDELKFLLDDLSAKLNNCLNTSPLKSYQKQVGFSNLESHSTEKFIAFCVHFLPSLRKIFEVFAKYFQSITEQSDGIEDSLAMFTSESQSIRKCMNLLLKVIKQIMSWKGFQLLDNTNILKKALVVFAPDVQNAKSLSCQDLVKHGIKHLSQFSDAIPSLSCAANFIQLLSLILIYTDDNDSREEISSISMQFLKKKWFDLDSKVSKAADVNANIKVILESYLKNLASTLKGLEYLAMDALPELISDDTSDTVFNTLTKTSINCYYKLMMSNIASHVKVYFTSRHSEEDQMKEWSVVFKIFQVLTNLLKCFGSRSNIGACLKYSKEVLQVFLKYGMPFLDKQFRDNKEDVICITKLLQVSTRYLQHVCCHSKVVKDATLLNHVPALKKNLEVFVLRVKVMMAVNKCEDAFWLGNLKNRDLKGEEILSQEFNEEEDEKASSDAGDGSAKSDSEQSSIVSDND